MQLQQRNVAILQGFWSPTLTNIKFIGLQHNGIHV